MSAPLPRGPIAYVMSRFPKLTETFILYELLALKDEGVDIRVFPLLRERQRLVQPEAVPLVEDAVYLPFVSPAIMASNLRLLLTRPRRYLGALVALIRDTVGSANYLFGGLAIFPKVVHMARLMEAAGIVHVHCHFSNHPAAAGFVVHRLTGIPYSFTAHGSDLHVDRHMLCRKTVEAAFVVAISEDNRRVIERECGPHSANKVDVIHCGVDTATFAPPAGGDSAAAVDPRPLTVTSIGTLHEVKGQAYLVEACRQLAEAGIGFRCRIVGEGPDEPMLRALVDRHGLGDRIAFEGSRTRSEIASILRDTDILVAPSVPTSSGRREGIPVVLMEGMSAGVAVVASRLSGIPELVRDGETGLLVPPRDATAIAEAIRRLHDDPRLRERLGTAAREHVLEQFDVRTNARRLGERIFAPASETPARGVPAAGRQRRGFTVALIGPDGAGKTTVGRRLDGRLPFPTSYLYMGVNPASGNRVLPTTRLVDAIRRRRVRPGAPPAPQRRGGEPPELPRRQGAAAAARGAIRSLLRTGNRLAEEWYRQALAWADLRRGRVVIFDRHFYSDYYATDIAASRRGLARRFHGFVLQRLYPKPDLVVYLDAPAEVLLERKGEGTLQSLEQMRSDYLALGRTLTDFTVIDATRPTDVVAADTSSAIVEFAERRNGRVLTAAGRRAGR